MRRQTYVFTAVAGAAALALGLFLFSTHSPEPRAAAAANPPAANAAQLPIAQVVLFSSGVGYFQREGQIDGNARIDLSFRAEDVNDLLKSMVLQDLGGGHISTVSYESHDPIERTLKSYAINLTSNPTFSQILNQTRGEKVEVVLQQSTTTQPGTLTGSIVGVEHQRQPVGKDGVVEVETLNLWCAEGMRSVKLNELQRLRFLNPVMESEVRRALDTLALSHDAQKKAVSLQFTGEGKRGVRVGYVVENPIWKTSYRLVMDKDNKPFLQGWAIVENPSDEDWNDVRMGLISGRPISFQMNLYDPLYIQRPVVEPELFASLRPPTYTGSLERAARDGEVAASDDRKQANEYKLRVRALRDEAETEQLTAGVGGRSGAQGARKLPMVLDPRQGVQSAAVAAELGDYFQYAIEHAVTLPRQKSALLPIVNQKVEGAKVSIFNENTHPKHPLLGLKFKNTSGLHLMQGPITVFENSVYAGDARILDLQPGEERLLSYAIDLGTEVEAVNPNPVDRITKVKIERGIIQATHLIQQSKVYNAKNRTEHDRLLVVEHPYRPEFNLVSETKPAERARDVYRFEVPVAAGKTGSLTVTEEHSQGQQITLSNTDDQQIRLFISTNTAILSEGIKDAVSKALELKGKLVLTQQELAQANRKLNDIVQDQTRLRANLKEMPPNADAYKRYLKKFDDQETEIEGLRDQIKKLQDQERQQRQALDGFLANLNVG
jgi:hypothetical protein